MPKRKVGPLPSANNSFVNTLMNHCKFMKKKDKYGNTNRMLQTPKHYENRCSYHVLCFAILENVLNSY